MPVDYEPLYSASPPLFKHFGPTFADYHRFGNTLNSRLSCNGKMSLRSCLIIRSDDELVVEDSAPPEQDNSPPCSPTKNKKKVVFADDRGFALEHVKVMTEPSDCPPRWRDEFLERVTLGAVATVDVTRWEPTFAQPASDYVEFRRRLERGCVCLENVMVKEAEESVTGTVKVKNLSFHKEVFVRVSPDAWRTSRDVPCVYVPSGCEGTSVYDLYDTFSFAFPVPPEATSQLQLCVGFRCEQQEYWDNNGGLNYRLKAVQPKAGQNGMVPKFQDAFTASIDTWTEFASWNHLVNDTPYW